MKEEPLFNEEKIRREAEKGLLEMEEYLKNPEKGEQDVNFRLGKSLGRLEYIKVLLEKGEINSGEALRIIGRIAKEDPHPTIRDKAQEIVDKFKDYM